MDKTFADNKPIFPKLLISGIDSLYVSYYLDGLGLDWEELAYRKEHLKQDKRQDFLNVAIGDETWALMPYGKFPYKYILRNAFFQVFLAQNNSPNCYVQFISQALWAKGIDWLQTGYIIGLRLSAVDRRARKQSRGWILPSILTFPQLISIKLILSAVPPKIIYGENTESFKALYSAHEPLSCVSTTRLRRLCNRVRNTGSMTSGGRIRAFGG